VTAHLPLSSFKMMVPPLNALNIVHYSVDPHPVSNSMLLKGRGLEVVVAVVCELQAT